MSRLRVSDFFLFLKASVVLENSSLKHLGLCQDGQAQNPLRQALGLLRRVIRGPKQ
jgi:hypothetical protein